MIKIYKTIEGSLEVISEVSAGCWINVVDPTGEDIARLVSYGIPQDFITYPLDIDERSRLEREDDGTMVILLRIPYYQGTRTDIPYSTIPMGIIVRENMIVTICRWQNEVTREFASGRMKSFSTSKRNRFVLRILLANASMFLVYLREINKLVDRVEDELQLSLKNKEVLELLKFQKCLVYFTTALKSNELLFERLQRIQLFRQYPEDEDLLEDVITENAQAIEMTNISSNILSGMMDAFASIISNNLNVVMKFLASTTIILSIPTIITGFFGMNVTIPGGDHPYAYLAIIGSFVVISVIVIILFLKRDWF